MNTYPGEIAIADFTYDLPADRIAPYPLPERDASRLLIYRNRSVSEDIFRNIADHIPSGSLMIFNNTRVVEARLLFEKSGGSQIEIFCLEPDSRYTDITTAMDQQSTVTWKCLVGRASRWPPGIKLEKRINTADREIVLYAELLGREDDHFIVQLSWTPENLSFAELLHETGVIPLPPYIKRKADITDAERYQTLYAYSPGSVAAPTAGLHFTDNMLNHLSGKDISHDFVTLHVGAGTFKPVKSELINDHAMHAEFIQVSKTTIENIHLYRNKHITAVGTTSLRALESLYWIGIKIISEKDILPGNLYIDQWYPYQNHPEIPVETALQAILEWMGKHATEKLLARTSLLIAPGYAMKIPKSLVTNFHQPRSTLLLLVAAFIGEDWRSIYGYALDNDFRFLSYGDGCLLFRP